MCDTLTDVVGVLGFLRMRLYIFVSVGNDSRIRRLLLRVAFAANCVLSASDPLDDSGLL